ncbi:Membrane transport protein [Planctomycetes bacterium CA13]|uniref:Membrane transport protein n=1 Tax=Novipirellula herctigrandis TaxID=2527986 RepID=A0A5C5YMY5_9BACT|nr:Membrane transport protein [Planctomycetes bacterium CA13]
MLTDLWPIIASVLGVFLVIGIGAMCRQLGVLNSEADVSLAKLTAKVLLPSLFADRILHGEQMQQFSTLWFPPVFGFSFTAVSFLIVWALAKRFGRYVGLDTDAKQRTFALCAGICNYGYIPLPLAVRFYPDAVVELILHNVGVDMALWSVGIAVIGGATSWQRAVLTPPVIAVVTTSLIRWCGVDQMIPASFHSAISMLGACSIPMGLMLSGAIIVDYLRETHWKDSGLVVAAAIGIRQILLPVLMLGVATLLGMCSPLMTPDLKLVVMLEAAMPAAVFPIVIVRLYERDTSTALRVVLSTSMAGILLVPLWLGIAKWFLGL